MGDTFRLLGDLDVGSGDADDLSSAIVSWLIAQQVVSPELVPCVPGELGYRPGPRRGVALRDPAAANGQWARLDVNGVQISTGRLVYHGGKSGVSDATCPRCGAIEPFSTFVAALDHWWADAVPEHSCLKCGHRSLINDWLLEPQWGVGHLQLTFWNWPPLGDAFRRDISAVAGQHRLLYISGAL